MLIGFAQD